MRTRLILLLMTALIAQAMSGCRSGKSRIWPEPSDDPGRDPKSTDLSD